jgi:hypothetical protein
MLHPSPCLSVSRFQLDSLLALLALPRWSSSNLASMACVRGRARTPRGSELQRWGQPRQKTVRINLAQEIVREMRASDDEAAPAEPADDQSYRQIDRLPRQGVRKERQEEGKNDIYCSILAEAAGPRWLFGFAGASGLDGWVGRRAVSSAFQVSLLCDAILC